MPKGGARPGSGPKLAYGVRRIQRKITLPPELDARVRQARGAVALSDLVIGLLQEYLEKQSRT